MVPWGATRALKVQTSHTDSGVSYGFELLRYLMFFAPLIYLHIFFAFSKRGRSNIDKMHLQNLCNIHHVTIGNAFVPKLTTETNSIHYIGHKSSGERSLHFTRSAWLVVGKIPSCHHLVNVDTYICRSSSPFMVWQPVIGNDKLYILDNTETDDPKHPAWVCSTVTHVHCP